MLCDRVIRDIQTGEEMAMLGILLMKGELSADEYLYRVRAIFPDRETGLYHIIRNQTDWELLNRIVSNLGLVH